MNNARSYHNLVMAPPEVPRDGAQVTTSQRVVVIIICLAAMFSFEIGAGLVDISSSQLLEGIICREHHDDVPYPQQTRAAKTRMSKPTWRCWSAGRRRVSSSRDC
ncbi:hypothetical protein ACCO45_002489 [Purpureocillium lilacinum]|uniref:Uncharacterized protein n=1 Tax=Purpureocillium lilacinum TaxID=33203 RepID=A0ACC4EA16_PURLI